MPGIIAVHDRSVSNSAKLSMQTKDIGHNLFRSNNYQTDEVSANNFYLLLKSLPSHHGGIFESERLIIACFGNLWYMGERFNKQVFLKFCRRFKESNKIEQVLLEMEGQYQMVIYDREKKRLFVISDKNSSHPFYYYHQEDQTIISPEILSLKGQLSRSVSIRDDAIVEFLMSGHLWGDGTFVDAIRRLGPGQFLTIDHSGLSIKFYYKPIFSDVDNRASMRELNTSLYHSIHKDLDKLPEGKKILTLSGGWDSRLLFGFLRERDIDFDTVSYSFGKISSRLSDTSIAKKIADKFEIPFDLYQADLSDDEIVLKNINNVIKATGGECDLAISQEALLGTSFYESMGNNYSTLLRSDEMWGGGDYALNATMAFIENWLFAPEELPLGRKLIKEELLENASNYIQKRRSEFTQEHIEPKEPHDLRYFFAWRLRKPRLLYNIAYFRMCYINHLSPFVLDNTVKSVLQIPAKYRQRKTHLKKMAITYFPDLFNGWGTATSYKKGPDKYTILYSNKSFVKTMQQNLLNNPPEKFEQVLNMEELEKLFDRTLDPQNIAVKKSGYNTKRYLNNLMRKSYYLTGAVKYGLKKMNKYHFPAVDTEYLYRIFTLSLALKQYEDF